MAKHLNINVRSKKQNVRSKKQNVEIKTCKIEGPLSQIQLIYFNKIMNNNRIEINITNKCNLSCQNCHQLCDHGTKFSDKDIGRNEIFYFIRDSIVNNKKWEKIGIIGGEPTLNQQLRIIVDLLMLYINKLGNPYIVIYTNGTNKQIIDDIISIYKDIRIENSMKNVKGPYIKRACMYFISPKDISKNTNLENLDCSEPIRCSMSFGSRGYFICHHAYTAARVFNMTGIKSLSDYTFNNTCNQFKFYCSNCGYNINHKYNNSLYSNYWSKIMD